MSIPSGTSVAKNASWYTFASIAQKLMAFLYFSITARIIGPSDIGSFMFAVSVTVMLGSVIDLGLTPVLIRNAAQNKEELKKLSSSIIWFKTITSIISFLVLLIIVLFWNKSLEISIMTIMAGIVMCLDSISLTLWGVLRSQHNLKFESLSMIFTQLITSVIGITGILLNFPIWNLAIALLCGSLFNTFYGYIKYNQQISGNGASYVKFSVIKSLWRAALPFALAAIFTRLYSYADQVLLATLIGEKALGLYSVPYKLTFALQFIPAAFAASIYPAMSSYHQHAKDKLSEIYNRSLFFLMLISAPIVGGTIAVASKLIHSLYTASYDSSILTLQVLILALVPSFLSYPVGSLLNSTHHQHQNTISMGLTMILNILLNLFLIPRFSHLGAAISTVVSLSFLTTINITYAWIKLDQKIKNVFTYFLIILSSAFMYFVVSEVNKYSPLIISVLVGVATYAILILLLNIIKKEELLFIFRTFRNRKESDPT